MKLNEHCEVVVLNVHGYPVEVYYDPYQNHLNGILKRLEYAYRRHHSKKAA